VFPDFFNTYYDRGSYRYAGSDSEVKKKLKKAKCKEAIEELRE
jgi:hypothetical protein